MEDMKFIIAAIILAIGFVGGAFMLSKVSLNTNPTVYVSPNPVEHIVSVSGSAKEKIVPDLLRIQMRVETQDKNATVSQRNNAETSTTLKNKLLALGISENEIQTSSYSLYPVYESVQNCEGTKDYCKWENVLKGYRAVQTVEIKTTNLKQGGAVLDIVSEIGTNTVFVDSVNFMLKDETKMALEKKLLKQAGTDAKERAQNIADGLGVKLGKVTSISQQMNYPYYYNTYDKVAMTAGAAPTPLSAGEVEVSSSVSVSYEIG